MSVPVPLLDSAGQFSRPRFSGRCDGLATVVAAQAEVAVVQEDFDIGEVLETDGYAFAAGGRGVVHTTRSQGISP